MFYNIFLKWLSGFNLGLDFWIIGILFQYLYYKVEERFTPQYCLATGLITYIFGQTLVRAFTLYSFFSYPTEISTTFPIVSSSYFIIGSLIIGIGLTKIIQVFSNAFSERKIWVWALATSIFVPILLISMF